MNFEREEKPLIDEIANNLETKVKELEKMEKVNQDLQEKIQNYQVCFGFLTFFVKNQTK